MTKVLVTGGAGFIGANLLHFLARERPHWELVNVDLLTYAGNLENLAALEGEPRYRFVRGDVADREAMLAFYQAERFDFVIHCAAESHVDRSIESPDAFLRTNILGTQALLDAARATLVKRHLQVSTDEVYGSLGQDGFFTEESPIRPNSPYAASKAAADLIVRAAWKTHGLDVVVTRCSNNYGPYQFPEKLIPLMIQNALADRQLPVYGDGSNVRDWLFVEDHCRALLLALEKGKSGAVYNIGGHNEWKNLDLVTLLLDKLGKPERLIKFVEDRKGHDQRYAIDAAKAERELGWRPTVMFPDGIGRTIAWYRENAAWMARVTSGAYQDYYRTMYQVGDDGAIQR